MMRIIDLEKKDLWQKAGGATALDDYGHQQN